MRTVRETAQERKRSQRLTSRPNYRARGLITERVKLCTREMSSLRRTAAPRKEPLVLNRQGSSRVVLLAKKFWELVPAGIIFGFVLATLLVVGASASATDLTGRVINGATKKPAVGDEVVLLLILGGNEKESARAKTDVAGRFRFTVTGPPGPRLVRVIHQGVAYDKMHKPGVNLLLFPLYSAAHTLDPFTPIMLTPPL